MPPTSSDAYERSRGDERGWREDRNERDVFIGTDSTSSSVSNKHRQLVLFGFVFYVVASPPDDAY